MAGITKDEASDLRSLINRVVECELDKQRATYAASDANHALEMFIHRQQQEKK